MRALSQTETRGRWRYRNETEARRSRTPSPILGRLAGREHCRPARGDVCYVPRNEGSSAAKVNTRL